MSATYGHRIIGTEAFTEERVGRRIAVQRPRRRIEVEPAKADRTIEIIRCGAAAPAKVRLMAYVFRNWTGRLCWSLIPRDETVATFRSIIDANAFCEMVNAREGWRRELTIASEQARAA